MIDIGPSGIHGTGAFAARDLAEDERIGTYEGRRYTARQALRKNWDSGLTYVFGLSDGSVIDAAVGGNATRHLNHSCAPNCIAYEERGADGASTIVFYAMRAIAAGEELFLDYSLQVDETEERSSFGCTCGTQLCRGTMLAASA
jgi:SET domain-containing protein